MTKKRFKVGVVFSAPRLGFTDNFECIMQIVRDLNLSYLRQTGADWGIALERCMENTLDIGVDCILVMDYDSVFTKDDVIRIVGTLQQTPEAAAVVPIQQSRRRNKPFNQPSYSPTSRIDLGHFGLTAIRAQSLAPLPHPWFHDETDPDGRWTNQATYKDGWFWQLFDAHGLLVLQDSRVVIGHIDQMILWTDQYGNTIYQHIQEFYDSGKPKGAFNANRYTDEIEGRESIDQEIGTSGDAECAASGGA